MFEEDGICIKILDWGYAIVGSNHESCGSPNYAAPEVISLPPSIGPHNDIWSIGVILFTMLVRDMPFKASTTPSLFTSIREMTPDYTRSGLTNGSVELLKKIFVKSTCRINCKDIIESDWFKSREVEDRFVTEL